MKSFPWMSAFLLIISVNNVEADNKDLSAMLIQTLQKQLQTCMDQNVDLIKRTCNGGNNYSNYIENKRPIDKVPPSSRSVAFHAGMDKGVFNLASNSKVVFDKVYLNEGNAYDSNTGIFNCPRGGIYVFHWTILTKPGKYFHTDFMVNGKVVGRSYLKAVSGHHSASSAVVQRLKKGDKAWIEPYDSYTGQFADNGWSFYSGYML